MKNELMFFEGREVEIFEFEGKVLFNPRHVGEILELESSAVRKAIGKMNDKQVIKLKNSDVKKGDIRKLNNAGENFLTESGVYKLVMRSNKPEAERFQDWVVDEVLPSIRQHGSYGVPSIDSETQAVLNIVNAKDNLEKALAIRDYKEILTLPLIEKIEEDKPKVDRYEKFLSNAGSFTATKLAIILGVKSAQSINKMLKDAGVIKKVGKQWLPTAKFMDKHSDWFNVYSVEVANKDSNREIITCNYTPNGVLGISELLGLAINEEEMEKLQ